MVQEMVSPKILLVEDNPNLSENISELLTINGFIVTDILDSAHLVEENLKKNPANLVLIDIKLKGKQNGIELATQIRRHFTIPIVFITSSSGKEIIEKVKHIKPDGFIVKPFTKESLITSIQLAIENFSSLDQAKSGTQLIHAPKSIDEIFIRDNGWLKKIEIDEIELIKTEGTYSRIITEGKQFTLRNTAKEVLGKLPDNQFLRVHKSYIVNLKKIEAFNSTVIKIAQHEIPIGRNFYKDLVNHVNKINN
ncbi:LytR/AlgR family response regulator transcription factor [Algoriphagus hitonicola]|uniref:Two component transcriptional regulator, LytTR family n=1 Tax=Algoriphagus hitonicola TaxID=435880 RepID=A0A1I2T9Q5_9BACT|nr:response regulator transcription factor [Algoriphagus hitonicola]SFG61572.1 two component transcriptional regulator, LytTR family [Algoriphagus hitonicola]